MKKIFLFILSFFLFSCAITNVAGQRQDLVSETEIKLMSYIREGMYYFKASKYLEAVTSFDKALMIEKSPKIQYNLALALERLGDNDRALSIMMELNQEFPFDITYKMAYARMLDLMGSRENAVSVYMESLAELQGKEDRKGYRYKIYRRLSDLYFKIGEEEDAICNAKLALNERNSNEEILRLDRFLLSVNNENDIITAFQDTKKDDANASNEHLFQEEIKIQNEQYDENGNLIEDSGENEEEEFINDPQTNTCKLKSVLAWNYFYNLKDNNLKVVHDVDFSRACLTNKDGYYPIFLVMEQIIKKYQKLSYKNSKKQSDDEDEDDDEEIADMSISDEIFLILPGISYAYLSALFDNYDIAKNGKTK